MRIRCDIAGLKFGRLTAISPIPESKPTRWKCVCECGNESTPQGGDLRNGRTRSCGCLLREVARSASGRPKGVRGKNRIDHTGKQFGRWTVVREVGLSKHNKVRWECRCACGYVGVNDAGSLVSGKTKSCGCIKTGAPASERRQKVEHGMSGTAEHRVWSELLNRCFNKSRAQYKNYGGRGIEVCNFIKEGPSSIEELIGKRPDFTRQREYSIDRINNDGHYSCGKCPQCIASDWPMNLRWATQKVQTRNTRRNRLITIDGQTKSMVEWAEATGISIQTISGRRIRGYTGTMLISQTPLPNR